MKPRREKRFPETYHKELRRKTPVPPEPWSLRDKLSVAGGFIFALLAFFVSDIGNIFKQRQLVSQRLEKWRTEYGLEEKRIKDLREIEYEFHGNGLPSSNPPRATPGSRQLHVQKIATAMGPKVGAQFLEIGANH